MISDNTVLSDYTIFRYVYTFEADKVILLAHTYPHKTLRKIEVTVCNHKICSSFNLWSDA